MVSRKTRSIVVLFGVLVLLASSCGGSDSSTMPEPTAETEAAEAEDVASDDSGKSGGDDDLDTGIDESEVAGEIEAFRVGLEASSANVGDQEFAAVGASFLGAEITLSLDAGVAVIEIDDEGPTGLSIFTDSGDVWQLAEGSEVVAITLPDDLGGEGDLIVVEAPVVSLADNSESMAVVTIHVGLLGAGSSEVVVDGEYALITGTLGTRTYIQIQDLIEQYPEVTTLVLLQIDGSENDQINVWTGRLIRDAGFATYVPSNGDISSGGVDLFTSGATRSLEPGAFVGVHSWADSDGGAEGADFPRDHPAHESQLDCFTEMLGEVEGTDFYFYTLEAAPADEIHRMTDEELAIYSLANAEADPGGLPMELVGPPAMYIEIEHNAFEKLAVSSCEVTGDSIELAASSPFLGEVTVTSTGPEGVFTWDDTVNELAIGVVDQLVVDGDQVAGDIDIDLPGFGLELVDVPIAVRCGAP